MAVTYLFASNIKLKMHCTSLPLAPYCNYPLGMENGYITDQQINATSYFIYYDVFLPHKARLNGLSAWCAFKLDTFQILEVWSSIFCCCFEHHFRMTVISNFRRLI